MTHGRLGTERTIVGWLLAGILMAGLSPHLAGQQQTERVPEKLIPVYLSDPLELDSTNAAVRSDLGEIRKRVESTAEALAKLEEQTKNLEGMTGIWLPLLLVVNVFLIIVVGSLYVTNRSLRAEVKEQKAMPDLMLVRLAGVEQRLQELIEKPRKTIRLQRAALQRKGRGR